MSLAPQKLRELILQSLFSLDMGSNNDELLVKMLMEQYATGRGATKGAVAEAKNIYALCDTLDPEIAAVSTSYNFDRIQAVERNILRLGVYELLIEKKTPEKIVLAEAVRLAKKFGSPEAGRFVNALLDTIYRKQQGQSPEEEELLSSAEALKKIEEISLEAQSIEAHTQDEADSQENKDN
jgi:transcription antitermination protein NusB